MPGSYTAAPCLALRLRTQGAGSGWDIEYVPGASVLAAQRRRGLYSILDGTMRLDYGMPGAARPASLDGASAYTTARGLT